MLFMQYKRSSAVAPRVSASPPPPRFPSSPSAADDDDDDSLVTYSRYTSIKKPAASAAPPLGSPGLDPPPIPATAAGMRGIDSKYSVPQSTASETTVTILAQASSAGVAVARRWSAAAMEEEDDDAEESSSREMVKEKLARWRSSCCERERSEEEKVLLEAEQGGEEHDKEEVVDCGGRRTWQQESEEMMRQGSDVVAENATDGKRDSAERGGAKATTLAGEDEKQWRTIEFRIISAQDLKKVGGRMQTYAEAYVAEEEEESGRRARTEIDSRNGRNPVWNQVLRLRLRREMLSRQPLACLTIDVFCKRWLAMGRRDRLLGSARIFLSDVLLIDDLPRSHNNPPPFNPIRCHAFWLRLPSGDRPQGFLNVWFPPSGRFYPPFLPATADTTTTSSFSNSAGSSPELIMHGP